MTTAEAQAIASAPYPDFIAAIGEDNTPPGGEATVAAWLTRGRITRRSRILDLACSTGYALRALTERGAGGGWGIDLSAAAVRQARRLSAGQRRPGNFGVADASALPFAAGSFTHVVAGSVFHFIAPQAAALDECARVLARAGRLCVATFYFREEPPGEVLDAVEAQLGFRPKAAWTLANTKRFFAQGFELEWQTTRALTLQTPQEIAAWCHYRIATATGPIRGYGPAARGAAVLRLIRTRLAINALRQHQRYAVQIWGWRG